MEKVNHKDNIVKLCQDIKKLSTDERVTDKLLFELLSEQRQDAHKPLPVADLGEEVDRLEGGTFYIAKHEGGVIYHIYNSIYYVVPLSQKSLYGALVELVDSKDEFANLGGEEKESYESYLSALAYILAAPTFVFYDAELTFDIATRLIQYINKFYEESLQEPLQKETYEEDEEFKETVLAIEEIKEAAKEL